MSLKTVNATFYTASTLQAIKRASTYLDMWIW